MLVDIFARRYDSLVLRENFEECDSRLLVQAFRILSEDIYPYYKDGKEDGAAVKFWTDIHSKLSRELGLQELSKQWFSYTTQWQGSDRVQTQRYTFVKVCENWMTQPVAGSPDRHIKERLSLIELGFRQREDEIAIMNSQAIKNPSGFLHQIKAARMERTESFKAAVEELNARFQQAGYDLNYHNGYVQIQSDHLLQREIETPFWALIALPDWSNVDLDMKEALDRRDGGGRDPAFYAARSLESAIKIISDKKGWTRGTEKGAHNYIDNLGSKANAFITGWESQCLKDYFTHVRNPFGHGPGSAKMPTLSKPQTEWAIEFSMSWIKALIRRM
jgi:hypothetical protein